MPKQRTPKHHREVADLRELLEPYPLMWTQEVPAVGCVSCYGLPGGIIHIIDYIHGGWDAYVPATEQNSISVTVAWLRRMIEKPGSATSAKSLTPGQAHGEMCNAVSRTTPIGEQSHRFAMLAKESIFRAQDRARHIEDDQLSRNMDVALSKLRTDLEALDRMWRRGFKR